MNHPVVVQLLELLSVFIQHTKALFISGIKINFRLCVRNGTAQNMGFKIPVQINLDPTVTYSVVIVN